MPGGRNGLCCLQSGAKRCLASFGLPEPTSRRNSSAAFLWSCVFMRVIWLRPQFLENSVCAISTERSSTLPEAATQVWKPRENVLSPASEDAPLRESSFAEGLHCKLRMIYVCFNRVHMTVNVNSSQEVLACMLEVGPRKLGEDSESFDQSQSR